MPLSGRGSSLRCGPGRIVRSSPNCSILGRFSRCSMAMEREFRPPSRLQGRRSVPMEDIVSLLIPVVFVVCLVLERLFPARPLPKVRFWLLKGFVFFVLTGAINALIPAIVGPHLGGLAVANAARLGLVGCAVVTLLVSEFLAYWVHRSMHRFFGLWRWTHQMHHSAERIDVAGAVYF